MLSEALDVVKLFVCVFVVILKNMRGDCKGAEVK